MHFACWMGHSEIVEFLIKDASLEINSKIIFGSTGFHFACGNGYLLIVEILLKDTRLEINSKNKL